MKYKFEKDGRFEYTEPEKWCWWCQLEDGTEMFQFDDRDGTYHFVGEIPHEKLKLASLYKHDDPSKRIDIVWQEGMILIHKYRVVRPYYSKEWVKVYMWGWKEGNSYSFHFILPDDRIIMSSKDNIDLVRFELLRK